MALVASGLTAWRGDRTLFSALSFELQPGQALWVRGANGSGKTTLLRMLCGLAQPAEGRVSWRGEDIRGVREAFNFALTYVGHDNAIKDDLTVSENLITAAGIGGAPAGHAAAQAALDRFGLSPQALLPGHALSQGQRKRAALVRLLLGPARPLWLLDEPYGALDSQAAALLDDTISAHLSSGGMLVYSTHQRPGFAGSEARCLDLDLAAAC